MQSRESEAATALEICPLAVPGPEAYSPANCQAPNNKGGFCPHLYYYQQYDDCSHYMRWLRKLLPVIRREVEHHAKTT